MAAECSATQVAVHVDPEIGRARSDVACDVRLMRTTVIERVRGDQASGRADEVGNGATEMSLHVLAYNLKRVIAILGSEPFVTALRV